jgi:hypothetical protein
VDISAELGVNPWQLELGVDAPQAKRLSVAATELAHAI